MPLDERENLAPWALSWQFWVAPVGVMAPDHSAAECDGEKYRRQTEIEGSGTEICPESEAVEAHGRSGELPLRIVANNASKNVEVTDP